MSQLLRSIAGLTLVLAVLGSLAGEPPWAEIPPAQWKGSLAAEVPALKRTAAAIVALPAKDAQPLTATTAAALPSGVYEVRLTLRPSHVANAVAFNAGLRVAGDGEPAAEWVGHSFARVHEPETRTARIVHNRSGPLAVRLDAYADGQIVERFRVAADLKKGGRDLEDGTSGLGGGDAGLDLDLDLSLAPERAVYYLVDKVEFRPLSRSGRVAKVEIDRIRYLPGATLKGAAILADVGGRGGTGALNLLLEHGLQERVPVKSLPVTLGPEPQTLAFELPMPRDELGYALVAEYVSADGADRSEASEFFNIASNFQRVAIFGGGLATRDAVLDDETVRRGLSEARAGYFNATEYFAWAEDDMVEMSPSADFWSSGQTNYRMHKPTIQRQIRLAHEQGVAVATYGKFVMSGLPGWETAYDYPNDHRGQYSYPVGMWDGVNVPVLDRRCSLDFRVYGKSPHVVGNPFQTWWAEFLPINPDASPRMVRIAAEECVRSIEMFGWDAIRWDGHPRGAGWVQCGRSGKYEAWAARRTQALVRYFKEIVAAKHPDFRHGYNYLLIEQDKAPAWAVEDYELDELCRDGGLLMNESIGNASEGWTFAQIARNLQVEGDLCRERGGYYLGICFAKSPRDVQIESALWAAAGCRPYNAAMSREVRRYCTRYSQYTFDERLRRLATPEKVLAPQGETRLWWQPFVYETPLAAGRRQLVVNLLNLPLEDKRPPREGKVEPKWEMPPGTDPVAFRLTLPPGMRATGASLLDPETLAVNALPLADNRFEVPSVACWRVVVIDLAVETGAPALASLYGVPKTFGVARTDVKETERKAEVVLDPGVEIWEVNKRMSGLTPEWEVKRTQEQAAIDTLEGAAYDQALEGRRTPPETLLKEWWKGASLPDDLALRSKAFDFGDLTPRRDGRNDIFYARGAMDYRLRLPLAFARLARFRVHDAALGGAVRQSPGMWLANGIPWRRYPEFDLLVFTGIPHCAIGAENSYALPHYIRAGGAAFFTGGEYAFGKGGYMYTVLERELLPVVCAGMQDTVYAETPAPLEPGPDFGELAVKADFTAQPRFWVRNQVVLKPDAKVFLKSGNRPVLVGWQLGKGRVACLLIDHRGRSDQSVTAFFDWSEWPNLVAAVMTWLAPEAGRSDPPVATGAGVKAIVEQLRGAGDEDDLAELGKAPVGGGLDMPGAGGARGGVELGGDALKQRCALIDRALAAGGPEVAATLAGQLASVGNLPLAVRLRTIGLLRQERPAAAAAAGRTSLQSSVSTLHGNGYLLLALAGDGEFARQVADPQSLAGEGDALAQERLRDLALAVALYPGADLVDEGRRRVDAWNRAEEAKRAEFAVVCGPDTAMLATSPYLDAEAIFARVAWLAYLARQDGKGYVAPFMRQWLMLGQYQDYCARSIDYIRSDQKLTGNVAAARVESWSSLSARLGALRDFTRPDVEALLISRPAEAAAALSAARFTAEVQSAINLLGDLDRDAAAAVLTPLKQAHAADLAAFAAARAP